jgi:hypothetical protein
LSRPFMVLLFAQPYELLTLWYEHMTLPVPACTASWKGLIKFCQRQSIDQCKGGCRLLKPNLQTLRILLANTYHKYSSCIVLSSMLEDTASTLLLGCLCVSCSLAMKCCGLDSRTSAIPMAIPKPGDLTHLCRRNNAGLLDATDSGVHQHPRQIGVNRET